MMLFSLILACAPADPGPDGTADSAPLNADTAGWWSAPADTGSPRPEADCDAADAAEALDPVVLEPADGEASRYALMWLTPQGDADALRFEVTDGLFDLFDIEAFVYQAPPDVDVAIELRWLADLDGNDRGVVATANANGPGGLEQLNWPGSAFVDDSGTYEVVVRTVEGSACDVPVWVQVLLGGW